MESPPPTHDSSSQKEQEVSADSHVDPFLKEALQNPRHRLTVLRMEMDIQRFMQNPDQQQFEFQHFPTSYLRLAAHRVAQHYGLQSTVLDNNIDGLGTKIVVWKTAESRYPTVCLSEVPAKQLENDKLEQVKIAIRPRPNNASRNDMNELGVKRSSVRTVEERKEEYDRARARIFSNFSSSDSEGAPSATIDGRSLCSNNDETEGCRNAVDEPEKILYTRDGGSSRVAIFRDREKDRYDPDYDRSYERYIRGLTPNQSIPLGPFNLQGFQPSFVQYESGFPQLSQLPRTQTSVSYRPASSPVMSPFCAMGMNQTSGDAVYMQWPSPTMMYAQSYEQLRHAFFQAPFYQQPLSFDYSQNF